MITSQNDSLFCGPTLKGGPPPMNQENHQGQRTNPYVPDPNYDTVFLYVPAASVGAIIGERDFMTDW